MMDCVLGQALRPLLPLPRDAASTPKQRRNDVPQILGSIAKEAMIFVGFDGFTSTSDMNA